LTIRAFTEATFFDGMSDRVGTIEPGKLAGLIAVEGDTLKDVKVLGDKANMRLVVKGGAVEVDRGL
jgi:imidazolonepropionase-like amidohydrolase